MKLPAISSARLKRWTNSECITLFEHCARDLQLRDDPKTNKAVMFLRQNRFKEFLEHTGSWCHTEYDTPAEHYRWNQLACLLKKYPFHSQDIDREAVALKKFDASEWRCKRMNQKLRARRRVYASGRRCTRGLPYESLYNRARSRILQVLGEEPDLQAIYDRCGFGPGSSIGVGGDETDGGMKLAAGVTCSPGALPYVKASLRRHAQAYGSICFGPWLAGQTSPDEVWRTDFVFTSHNNITTVPKTALTNRTIAIEPVWNTWIQKGIDVVMRELLLRAGIDLSDQTTNQRLALLGSLYGTYATLDLSAASDSICIELCRELLPPKWFALLMSCRSPSYRLGENPEPIRYEKIASMGNGFCFPLETIIFDAVVTAAYAVTGDRDYSVYGDDIIVRQGAALLVKEYLHEFGFKLNTDKSFVFGPFRESCGADFYQGVQVRPYYVDEPPKHWWDVYKWLNGIRRHLGVGYTWDYLYKIIPESWRLLKPPPGNKATLELPRYLENGSMFYRFTKADENTDDAIIVSMDQFVSSPYAEWCRKTLRWCWYGIMHTPVCREEFNPLLQWYGCLHGSLAGLDGTGVGFARRNTVRTRIRSTRDVVSPSHFWRGSVPTAPYSLIRNADVKTWSIRPGPWHVKTGG